MDKSIVNPSNYNCIEDDEIDLRELWKVIKEGKKTILLIVIFVTIMAFIKVISTPNSYKSEARLVPVKSDSGSSLAGLGGLAAMAGVNINSGGGMSPDVAYYSLLNDYTFMKHFVIKNNFDKYYTNPNRDERFVFVFGFGNIYRLFHVQNTNTESEMDQESKIYNIVKLIQSRLSITSDKKSGLISISYIDEDRSFPPVIINAFLKDASKYLVKNQLESIDNQLRYFQLELRKVEDVELRQSISAVISKILEQKIKIKVKRYYQCDVLTEPYVPYIKDKAKPKRSLILIVSFITSLIIGIFIVFFLNFIKNNDKSKENEPII
jgi:uncharacterized protein involved in exopolysaccharide biosynthesis